MCENTHLKPVPSPDKRGGLLVEKISELHKRATRFFSVNLGKTLSTLCGRWLNCLCYAAHIAKVSAPSMFSKHETHSVLLQQEAISQKGSVLFPEGYSKAEKGWDFDILCMRSPRVRGEFCKCTSLHALIRSVANIRTLKYIYL